MEATNTFAKLKRLMEQALLSAVYCNARDAAVWPVCKGFLSFAVHAVVPEAHCMC